MTSSYSNKISIVTFFLLFAVFQCNCNGKPQKDFFVKSVTKAVISLNGDWKISINPPKEFWKINTLDETWKDIQVPGEVMMQGFSIKSDTPFAYKKKIKIPSDYKDKIIYLQFDGVYSYARVWVNGNYVRDHFGGFTSWKCDITPFVEPGEKVTLTVEVTDRADDISYASGYAKHQIGGILRSVTLKALPKIYPEVVQIETDLDDDYKNADLIISGKLNKELKNSKIEVKLFDQNQKEIKLKNSVFLLGDESSFKISNFVDTPKKWDAEHPNLYTLQVSFYDNDHDLQWNKKYKFGFREVKVVGNIFLVNGKPVKLRGACRHDVHPTLGRVSTPEYDLKDVLLTKEANMNYIRTSHYPPTDYFLSLCDEYGIYVEDETAVCFIIDYRIKGYEVASKSQSDPAYTNRYLSQLEEMVDAHRNHPSVVIWSIGNESIYGENFQKSYEWIQENDKTRPIKFSYPGTEPDGVKVYEILSKHYPDVEGNKTDFGIKVTGFDFNKMPVIFDEWAHVAAYNNETIQEDPNIRSFWGQSLDQMWTKTFDADGGLGGAIWGMIDETFMLPKDLEGFRDWWGIKDKTVLPYKGTNVGYGEWGIVDVWRRKKPEFWNVKKSYTPIKLLSTTIRNYDKGADVKIPIYNRFDHTNLNEVTIKYDYNDKIVTLKPFDLEPHKKGMLVLPIADWDINKDIGLGFYTREGQLIDNYNIRQESKKPVKIEEEKVTEKVKFTDDKDILTVYTDGGDFVFDKNTGLLKVVKNGDESIAVSGPFMTLRTKGKSRTSSSNFINDYGKDWKMIKFASSAKGGDIFIKIQGVSNKIKTLYELKINNNGELITTYTYNNIPDEYIRELGIRYSFEPIFDKLTWERKGYWSAYPEGHLSSNHGEVPLYSKTNRTYREKPQKSWAQDTKSFYYNGTSDEVGSDLTFVAKATKEHIKSYNLFKGDDKIVAVESDGSISCRIEKKGDSVDLFLNNKLDYVDLSWGNYQRNIKVGSSYKGKAYIIINMNSKPGSP